MAVMAFGLLGFMLLQGQAAQGRTAGREMSRATIVAKNHSEILQLLDYADPLLTPGNHPAISTKYGNFIYNTTWSVSKNTTKLKTIVVNTSWHIKDNQKGMQTKNLNFTLLKSE